MENTLSEICSKLDSIDKKIDELNSKINQNSKDCERMTSHITFIETVYEHVKNPMMFIVNRINKISYRNSLT